MSILRDEVQCLYDAYVESLDEDRLEQWTELFTEKCLYQVIPRENFERDLPLATLLCESRAALRDRVAALRRTALFAPRYLRHLVTNVRFAEGPAELQVRANYAVFETCVDEPTQLLSVGRYLDVIVRDEGRLRFREKRCVYDSLLVPNSLVYPL